MSFESVWKEIREFKYKDDRDYNVVRTQLSFFGKGNAPGFLTPWSEEASCSAAMMELCMNAFKNVFIVAYSSVLAFVLIPFEIAFLENEDGYGLGDWSACLVSIPYYALSFVGDLAMNLVAMVTRTLATVVSPVVEMLSNTLAPA